MRGTKQEVPAGFTAPGRNHPSPVPGIEWRLTDLCNYSCDYCDLGRNKKKHLHPGHADEQTINAVIVHLSDLPRPCLVKFSGAEETTHPQFLDVLGRVVSLGHRIALTTNFSWPLSKWRRFVDVCGAGLQMMTASLHLGQVSEDVFFEKAVAFSRLLPQPEKFIVTSVVLEDNFSRIKRIYERFQAEGVSMSLQRYKDSRGFIRYPDKLERELAGFPFIEKTEEIVTFDSYGVLCETGHLFFIIMPDGTVTRCYSQPFVHNYLGNIKDKNFKKYNSAKPCLAEKCLCTVPANRNLILFDQKAGRLGILCHSIANQKKRLERAIKKLIPK